MAADVVETVWYQEDSASPIVVSKPASFASGQILVAVIVQHNNPSAQTDLTTPVGWTFQGALDGTLSDGKVFSYVFTGSDPATWNFPYRATADVTLGLFRITGADTTPTIVVTSTPTGTVATPMDSPSVTPTGADDLLICVLANHGNGAAFSETDPAGMTDLGQVQVAGNFFATAAAKEQLASSSPTGVRTWTSISPTGQTGGTLSIAVKSAGGGAPTPPPPYPSIRDRPTVPSRPTVRRRVTSPPLPPPVMTLFAVRPPRELRGVPARRGHAFMPVPPQVLVPNPNLVQVLDRTRLKLAKYFRTRGATPVQTQLPAPPPAFVPIAVRTRPRALRLSRGHTAWPVPTQVAPAAPNYPQQGERARGRGLRPARGRIAAPPASQVAAPLFDRIRLRIARLFRGTIRPVVPPQIIIVPPGRVAQATRARRNQFAARRHRGGVDGWMVQGVHVCITPRPSTGITPNSVGDITPRPDTGITEAPC